MVYYLHSKHLNEKRVGGRAQLLNRAAALAAWALLGPLQFPSVLSLTWAWNAYGRVPQSCAKHTPGSRQEAVASKTVFLLNISVNSQKKLASRLDETTGRCLTLERNQRFFKELTDVWCKMTTVLVRTRNRLLFLRKKNI